MDDVWEHFNQMAGAVSSLQPAQHSTSTKQIIPQVLPSLLPSFVQEIVNTVITVTELP